MDECDVVCSIVVWWVYGVDARAAPWASVGGEEFGWRSLATNHLPFTHLRPATTQLSPLHRTPAPHFAFGADAPPLHRHSVDGYVVCIRGALVEV